MDRAGAAALDETDPLAGLRDRFELPDGLIYLDGNSLGPLPRSVAARLRRVIDEEWGEGLIGSWNEAGWIDLTDRVAERLARLLGGDPGEVKVGDSTTVNLSISLDAVLPHVAGGVVLTEAGNFPTDLYVAEAAAARHGKQLVRVPKGEVLSRLGPDVGLLLLTHVDYRTAERWDAPAVTTAAHAAGALVCWDLAHSAGAVEVDLHAWGADLAIGCTYKYLNGGPGAPAYLYMRADLADDVAPPIPGWWGHADPFGFSPSYRPAPGADRFMIGTPPILALAAVDEALAVFDDVDVAHVEAKARALTDLFVELVDIHAAEAVVLSPRAAGLRGAHVLLGHPDAYSVVQALIDRGVVGDFRPPDGMRFGLAPLTTRFVDVWDAVQALSDVLLTGAFDEPAYRRRKPVV